MAATWRFVVPWMRVSAQRVSQRSRYAWASAERLEAEPLERRGLRVADRRLDFPLPIGIADATRQGDGAVVGEHVAVERVQRRVVDVRREHALAQVVQDHDPDGAAEPPEARLVQLGPAPGAGLEGQEPDALAAVAQGEDEEPRAAVLPGERVAHHGPVAVVDLSLLPGGGHDHRDGPRGSAGRGASRRSAGRWRTARGSRGRRRGPARSPWRCGPGRGPARSAPGRARRRWRWGLGSSGGGQAGRVTGTAEGPPKSVDT